MIRGSTNTYRKSDAAERIRTVVKLPADELEAIDSWGVPAGYPSRTAAIRALLKQGLEAARKGGGPMEEARLEG